MQDAVLKTTQVVKQYGSRTALAGVDVEIGAGEFVALLGPNGAGKSTLFQLLCGLFVPDDGDIRVQGFDMRREPVKALASIGVVFQQATLDLDLSIEANLRLHARLHGINGADIGARVARELDRLGLRERTGDSCRSLSGGNRRKVELARALLHQPPVLLMDEATVGLDPASRVGLVDYVHELCRDRRHAVLWATHLVDEAERADRVIVLHHGKVIAEGKPSELAAQAGKADLSAAFLAMTSDA